MSDYDHKKSNSGTLPVLPVQNVVETLKYYKETLGFTELFHQPAEDVSQPLFPAIFPK